MILCRKSSMPFLVTLRYVTQTIACIIWFVFMCIFLQDIYVRIEGEGLKHYASNKGPFLR